MKKLIKNLKLRIENIILCIRFPFLRPHNRWTLKKTKKWFGSFTELDGMPDVWRNAFGIEMCKELKRQLKKEHYLHKYIIMDVKEKYGELRWYDNGASEEIHNIVGKYTRLSTTICWKCGANHTEYVSKGWVYFYCPDCINKEYLENYMSIEEYFAPDEDE